MHNVGICIQKKDQCLRSTYLISINKQLWNEIDEKASAFLLKTQLDFFQISVRNCHTSSGKTICGILKVCWTPTVDSKSFQCFTRHFSCLAVQEKNWWFCSWANHFSKDLYFTSCYLLLVVQELVADQQCKLDIVLRVDA